MATTNDSCCEKTGAAGTSPLWLPKAGFLLVCLLLGAFCLKEASPGCGPDYGCLQPYFIRFWLIDYGDGYLRRAFLGSVVGLIIGDRLPYWMLVAMVVAVTTIWIAMSAWMVKRASLNNWALVAAFLIGPPLALARENLGDTMHVIIAFFLAAFLLPGRCAAWAILALTPFAVAVHEASVFLVLPAAAFVVCRQWGLQLRIAPVMAGTLILALAFALLGEEVPTVPANRILVHADGSEVLFSGNAMPYPGFDALGFTMERYFGSLFSAAFTAIRLVCTLVWPVVLLILMSSRTGAWTALNNFLVLLGVSAPIYLIAWDWGRFSIFLLVMAVATTARGVDLGQAVEVKRLVARSGFKGIPAPQLPGFTPFLFALLFAPWNNYTQDGLEPWNAIALLGAMGVIWWSGRPMSQSCEVSASRAT